MEYRSGTGASASPTPVHYSGWFSRNAALFDSSRSRGGAHVVHPARADDRSWLRGTEGSALALCGICIPYTLGYGEAAAAPHPRGRTWSSRSSA